MHQLTLAEISKALLAKQFSSFEITSYLLQRINKLDPQLNSFITVTEELALAQAKAADERRAQGKYHELLGVPIAHKDLFCTEGVCTSCGSKMLANFIAPYNATVVQKLINTGCVTLGKTNLDEFAMGSSSETSYYGPVKNPWDLTRVPGGSSGGSAVAVAARLVPATTGTDTGGSIRQPSALTGVTGIKPTYGLVSRWGMIAYASSLDQGGPIAKTAEDCALLLQAMAGFDPKDSTSISQEVPDYYSQLDKKIAGLKIGVPKEFFSGGLDVRIEQRLQTALQELEKLGAEIKEISLPNLEQAISAYYVIAPAEASSNLSRFDGVRFGYRCENPRDLQDMYSRTRTEGFGAEVRRRILVGTYALSAGYYDAYYLKALKIRRLIKNDFMQAFAGVDVIFSPTTPNPAWQIGEKVGDPVSQYLEDIYTITANLVGIPALSMPVGFADGLPVGGQLLAPYFAEGLLLNIAHQYQQVTDWHRQVPNGF